MQWYEWYIVMWKHGLDFTGRTSRRGYWYAVLMNVLIWIVINIVGAVEMIGASNYVTSSAFAAVFSAVSALYALAALIPGLALSARRLHDTGRSAWNLLWILIPMVGVLVFLVLFLQGSDPQQPNRYGLTDAF